MAYKNLGDVFRQRALGDFLQAAANLDGHLVAIAVDKRKKWLSLRPEASADVASWLGLKSSWSAWSLEAMMRKAQFLSIMVSVWSRPYSDITWLTDEDEFVANDLRHDDALSTVGRISSVYLSHPMRKLALNTTSQDSGSRLFEDFCAIPDLAAGMLGEVVRHLSRAPNWKGEHPIVLTDCISQKADVICDWFWDNATRLRKTLIALDTHPNNLFSVRVVSKLDELSAAHYLASCGENTDVDLRLQTAEY